jgi:hypothetical protein
MSKLTYLPAGMLTLDVTINNGKLSGNWIQKSELKNKK